MKAALGFTVPRESSRDLSPQLKQLVSRSVAVLGQVIEHQLGRGGLRRIELIRGEMATLRGLSPRARHRSLALLLRKLRKISPAERQAIAHAFTLMLELMNACENAWRTSRLRGRSRPGDSSPRSDNRIVYVLTAHPSEARSPENIAIYQSIQGTLERALLGGFENHEEALRFHLEQAWRLASAPQTRPSVEDEARHVYSTLLRTSNLETLLGAEQELCPVRIRSWVGGDKDGHPYVNEKSLRHSLQLSRALLLEHLRSTLIAAEDSIAPNRFATLSDAARELARLRPGDGSRVKIARRILTNIIAGQRMKLGAAHPALARAEALFKLFPGLVVPLELRESSELLREALRPSAIRKSGITKSGITRMLRELGSIARGGEPLWYARGLIISMASSVADVRAGIDLVKETLHRPCLPVIPLFEQRAALEQGPAVIRELLGDDRFLQILRSNWRNELEVMLGYSDSAKEAGSLKSRMLIARAVRRIDAIVRQKGITPIFFHGSGGSVDRGGGSIEEQTAWWPISALRVFKATIQGEMVQRTFASPEITRSQLERISEEARNPRQFGAQRPAAREKRAILDFSERASRAYREQVRNPDFTAVTRGATLYSYLDVLRMGSRPVQRKTAPSGEQGLATAGLRAIPWVLCWTQTRTLFPSWWGIGSAWLGTAVQERRALRRVFESDALFRSYVKLLGFTLSKVELPVWRLYLETSDLPRPLVRKTLASFEREYAAACAFVRNVSGNRELLWFRPWLATSIRLRSPMIHPLNVLQILAMKERDARLLRTTVTGIASGMMTTG